VPRAVQISGDGLVRASKLQSLGAIRGATRLARQVH
jgi:hypothetical protein